MKKLIITHANCVDGCTAKAIFQKNYGSSAEYLELDHADYNEKFPEKVKLLESVLEDYKDTEVIMADICLPTPWLDIILAGNNSLVILDHHATSIPFVDNLLERVDSGEIDGNKLHINFSRDNTQSGAELAWEYMNPMETAPKFVQHVGDGDLWKFKHEGTKELYAALGAIETPRNIESTTWSELLESDEKVAELIESGKVVRQRYISEVMSYVPDATSVSLFGVSGLMVFAPSKYKSELGAELAKISGTYGLIVDLNNTGAVSCSLRSVAPFDVSVLAKQANGGGHAQAAAFRVRDAAELYEILDKPKKLKI